MDMFVDTFLTNPALLIGLAAIIFAISLLLILKRLISFVLTCIIIAAASVSGYTLFNHAEVQQYLRGNYEEMTGRELPDVPEEEKSKNLIDYGSDAWNSAKNLFKSDKTEETPSE